MPSISVVTVNLNNAVGLERTIKSVLSQTFADFEYLVIDGASTDNSKDILSIHSSQIDYWVSEPDHGVYHAMNKGLDASKGDYIWFLNSGDVFLDSSTLERTIEGINGEDILYGNLLIQEGRKSWLKEYPEKVSLSYLLFEALPHPAMITKRSVLAGMGGFDEKLRIVADWAFYTLAIIRDNATYKHLSSPLAVFPFDGLSSKPENQSLVEREKRQVLDTHFCNLMDDLDDLVMLRSMQESLKRSKTIRLLNSLGILKVKGTF